MRFKLMWEPIPQTSWGLSLSNLLPKEEWDKLRRKAYKKAGFECEVCGDMPVQTVGDGALNAHEVWAFTERPRVQRLVRVECLCKLCHDCKHWGRSTQSRGIGYQRELLKHMVKVNKCTMEDILGELERLKQLNYKRVDRRYRVFAGRKELYIG